MAKRKGSTTQPVPLHRAYEEAVNDDALAAQMGLSRVRKYQVQGDILSGKYPKEPTMRRHLEKCGYRMFQDELWLREV